MGFYALVFSRLAFIKHPGRYLAELYLLQTSSLDKPSIFWVVRHHLLLSRVVSPPLPNIRISFS